MDVTTDNQEFSMKTSQRIFATIVAIVAIAHSSAVQSADDLLPSEVTILVNHALESQPGIDRKSVTTPLIARMRTEELSEIERFFKGEAHFLHLQPNDSRDRFWEFRSRNDDIGRVASQRLMVIRINAFGMVDELLEKDIPTYQERFGVRADDRHGIAFPVQRTAEALAEKDRASQALDLLVGYVRSHERFDAPYSAYALPGQFFALAAKNGRADEFRELNDWVLTGLNATIDERLKNPQQSGPKTNELPGEVFSSLFADRDLDFYEWTAEFMKLRDRIAEGIATARNRPGQ
jgi:hypothetical protein